MKTIGHPLREALHRKLARVTGGLNGDGAGRGGRSVHLNLANSVQVVLQIGTIHVNGQEHDGTSGAFGWLAVWRMRDGLACKSGDLGLKHGQPTACS